MACWRKQRRVWTRSFASAPICSGSRRAGGMTAPTTSGIKRSINASANAPTRCGSGRVVRKARPTSTGFGRAPLRRADHPVSRFRGLLRLPTAPTQYRYSALNSPLPKRANTCPAVEPSLARGFFSHVHGGAMQRMTSMERAFHLARSGKFTPLTEVVTTLDREGYSESNSRPASKMTIDRSDQAARPEPLDRDLSRGVQGN